MDTVRKLLDLHLDLTVAPSEKENCAKVLASTPRKMNIRLNKIRETYPNASIIAIDEEFGMGYYTIQLGETDMTQKIENEIEESDIIQLEGIDMSQKIENEIKKYLNIEVIGVTEYETTIEFELYDHLDKPYNFKDDINSIIESITPLIVPYEIYKIEYSDEEFWNGEEMVKSNLSCTMTIKKHKMTKTIIKELGSHYFPGFYNSIFCHPDEFIDYESEDKAYLQEIVGSDKKINVEYDYYDFEEYKKDVGKAYMETYIEAINEALPYEITEHINYLLELANDDSLEIVSPKYYNYSTDSCWCNVKTNMVTLQMIKEYTLKDEKAEKYILDHFTSCDGFISFISNDIDYWKKLNICEYEDRMIIALLDMLIALSGENVFRKINVSVAEDICQICYAHPIIEYNGEKYNSIEEFEKVYK